MSNTTAATLAPTKAGSPQDAHTSAPMVRLRAASWLSHDGLDEEANCAPGNTAAGDEAVLSCGNGFCCDANRPDANGDASKGCCETSTDRFQLSNRQMVNGSSPVSASAAQTQSHTISSRAAVSTADSDGDDDSGDDGDGDGSSQISTTSSTSSTSPTLISTPTSTAISTHTHAQASSQAHAGNPSQAQASTSSHAPAHTSVVVVTSVVDQPGRGSSTLVSSKTSVIAEPASTSAASTSSPTASKHNDVGTIVGPAVAVPLAIIALAGVLFFVWRRRKQRKNSYDGSNHAGYQPEDPVDMYAAHKALPPKMPELESPDPQKTSIGTAPPSYRGVSSVANTPNMSGNPILPGVVPSSRNSGPPQNTPVAAGSSPPMPQDPVETEPSELPGSTYHPYRPAGKTGS
ncbi:MAG: hypothetical protein Q9191_004586 [Dirinaria sp. TL-2023a]